MVLTNDDLNRLLRSVEIGKTPVVISDNIEFISKEKWDGERSVANRVLEDWRIDAESASPQRIGSNYSTKFRSDRGEDLFAWLSKHQEFITGGAGLTYKLRDVTTFLYPGSQEMMVITFTQQPVNPKGRLYNTPVRKRQYWVQENRRWKIVSESVL